MLRAVEDNHGTSPFSSSADANPVRQVGTFSILLSSRDRNGLDQLVSNVADISGVDIQTNHISNGHSDPLYGIEALPNLLIFWVGEHWADELEELVRRPPKQRPPAIIVGDTQDQEAMRLAMRAGAIDYIVPGFDAHELQATIRELIDQDKQDTAKTSAPMTSVINAKGGSGASLIACNIAHMMSAVSSKNVALVDMDLQFGSLCHYLDMEPKYGLLEALHNVYELDEMALEGFMLKHPSGLHLLDVKPGELFIPDNISQEHLTKLLELMVDHYDQVVVDLPRHIGMLNSTVLQMSDKVIVVLQQSISHLRDTRRLLDILQKEIGIPSNKISIVLNRHDKKSDLILPDIEKAIGQKINATIPNGFQQVTTSINEGLPLYEVSRKSGLTRAIGKLSTDLSGRNPGTPQQSGIINRILRSLKGA